MTNTPLPNTDVPALPPKVGGGGRWWIFPAIIVGLLGFQIIISLVGVYLAQVSQSAVVESDYYNRAVHWDDYEARVRASQALGWQMTFRTQPAPAAEAMLGRRIVKITLQNRTGQMLQGATIEGKFFHHAHPRDGQNIRFTEVSTEPGAYQAQVPLRQAGIWEFRLLAKRGPDEFLIDSQEEILGTAH